MASQINAIAGSSIHVLYQIVKITIHNALFFKFHFSKLNDVTLVENFAMMLVIGKK